MFFLACIEVVNQKLPFKDQKSNIQRMRKMNTIYQSNAISSAKKAIFGGEKIIAVAKGCELLFCDENIKAQRRISVGYFIHQILVVDFDYVLLFSQDAIIKIFKKQRIEYPFRFLNKTEKITKVAKIGMFCVLLTTNNSIFVIHIDRLSDPLDQFSKLICYDFCIFGCYLCILHQSLEYESTNRKEQKPTLSFLKVIQNEFFFEDSVESVHATFLNTIQSSLFLFGDNGVYQLNGTQVKKSHSRKSNPLIHFNDPEYYFEESTSFSKNLTNKKISKKRNIYIDSFIRKENKDCEIIRSHLQRQSPEDIEFEDYMAQKYIFNDMDQPNTQHFCDSDDLTDFFKPKTTFSRFQSSIDKDLDTPINYDQKRNEYLTDALQNTNIGCINHTKNFKTPGQHLTNKDLNFHFQSENKDLNQVHPFNYHRKSSHRTISAHQKHLQHRNDIQWVFDKSGKHKSFKSLFNLIVESTKYSVMFTSKTSLGIFVFYSNNELYLLNRAFNKFSVGFFHNQINDIVQIGKNYFFAYSFYENSYIFTIKNLDSIKSRKTDIEIAVNDKLETFETSKGTKEDILQSLRFEDISIVRIIKNRFLQKILKITKTHIYGLIYPNLFTMIVIDKFKYAFKLLETFKDNIITIKALKEKILINFEDYSMEYELGEQHEKKISLNCNNKFTAGNQYHDQHGNQLLKRSLTTSLDELGEYIVHEQKSKKYSVLFTKCKDCFHLQLFKNAKKIKIMALEAEVLSIYIKKKRIYVSFINGLFCTYDFQFSPIYIHQATPFISICCLEKFSVIICITGCGKIYSFSKKLILTSDLHLKMKKTFLFKKKLYILSEFLYRYDFLKNKLKIVTDSIIDDVIPFKTMLIAFRKNRLLQLDAKKKRVTRYEEFDEKIRAYDKFEKIEVYGFSTRAKKESNFSYKSKIKIRTPEIKPAILTLADTFLKHVSILSQQHILILMIDLKTYSSIITIKHPFQDSGSVLTLSILNKCLDIAVVKNFIFLLFTSELQVFEIVDDFIVYLTSIKDFGALKKLYCFENESFIIVYVEDSFKGVSIYKFSIKTKKHHHHCDIPHSNELILHLNKQCLLSLQDKSLFSLFDIDSKKYTTLSKFGFRYLHHAYEIQGMGGLNDSAYIVSEFGSLYLLE